MVWLIMESPNSRPEARTGQCVADKSNLHSAIQSTRRNASRSERIPGIEMPRECPSAFRIEPAAAGTDSAKRRSVRLPIAIAPVRYHVRCCASQEKGRCGGRANLAGLTPRRNHGRPMRSQDDAVDVPAFPCKLGMASTSASACSESLRLAPVS